MVEKGLIPSEGLKQLPVEKEVQKNQPISEFQSQIEALIPTAGTIHLTEEQKKILYAPVDEKQVEIRPDGLVYLPWSIYVTRLRDVFGMSWALIPKGNPSLKGDLILWGFWLVVDGHLQGFAVGEQLYQSTNATMTYGDALEGATSNALMRLCKRNGISLELWDPSFIRKWKKEYAESYPAIWPDGKPKTDKNGKQKTEWRKKGQVSNGNVEDIQEVEPIPSTTDQDMETFKKESGLITGEFKDELGKVKNIDALKTIWKNIVGGKKNLLPEHFQQLEGIKEELKEKLK